MNGAQYVNTQELRRFVPLAELTHDNLNDLAKKTVVEELGKGRTLFKKGDSINKSFYLLSGEVTLSAGAGADKLITGGTPGARFPLEHKNPRPATAIARSDVRFIRIDNDLLDILLTWDQNAGYMVTEIEAQPEVQEDDSDWMMQMLKSNIFHRIPPTNIQAVFMRMEAVPFRAGDVVIRQGDEGDFYYHIKQGRCVVTHTASKSGKVIKLAELDAGQGFGEEALIANTRRNANITMLTDGVMMRLGKADFEQLLKAPVLQTLGYEKAKAIVAERGATWLDVRLESEFRNASIPGAINIPLYMLRIKASALDKGHPYVVYCDTGRRSSSAAYLLNERGFDAYVLEGGMMAIKDGQAA
jgi:CRP-like cAMP-binding protein/rhodanese-related sulfurtransferase